MKILCYSLQLDNYWSDCDTRQVQAISARIYNIELLFLYCKCNILVISY